MINHWKSLREKFLDLSENMTTLSFFLDTNFFITLFFLQTFKIIEIKKCSGSNYILDSCLSWVVQIPNKSEVKGLKLKVCIPVAFTELNVSLPSCPIPKYVIKVKTGAENEKINKCLRILCL